MALSISHIAEDIFARMANEKRDAFLEVTGLAAEADTAFVHALPELASCEAQIEPMGGRSFDGASRVDVVVRLRPGVAAGFELKLGTARLTKRRFDGEWLQPCAPSHADRRWSGNVMAALDRRFGNHVADELAVKVDGERLQLIRPWFLVARKGVLKALRNDPPSFGSAVRQLAFEDVVAHFGGREAFNLLVRSMLDVDYFEEWVLNDAG